MDSAFSCILFPEISGEDALILASFCIAREVGTVIRFEITRDSVIRGFDLGLGGEKIIQHLERLSGGGVNQNLRWTIKDWEDRYSAVSLHQGTILTLAEDRRYLARAEPLASLISLVLAPGIYLLSTSDWEKAVQALHKAGIDIIARPLADASKDGLGYSPYPQPDFLTPPSIERVFQEPVFQQEAFPPEPNHGDTHQERLRGVLRKMGFSKQEEDELNARIDRRIILNESQLVGGTIRYEKLEAKNLDYVGKNAVAKQAISLKSFVEVLWVNTEGELNRIFGIPEALEKLGGETILVIKPLSQTIPPSSDKSLFSPDSRAFGEIIRLPLAKIRLLRRIKQSFFGE